MAVREGVLKHPPLFYVVASIRFQPWMMLHAKIPELQEVLRDRFPVFNQLAIAAGLHTNSESPIPPMQPQRPTMWAFHTNDRRTGCQISADHIFVHTLAYERFSGFAEQVRFVLKSYLQFAGRMDVNVIGLRYLDRITPAPGEGLKNYVPTEFLPFEDGTNSYPLLGGHTQSTYKTEDGILQARFWTGQNMLSVPDDLVPLYMLTQDLTQGRAPFFEPVKTGAGILDTDSIWQAANPEQLSEIQVVQRLENLHAHANGFFRKVCLNHAFDKWQGVA